MIYRSLAETPDDFGPCAITIGNFDGVHRGHRQILRRVAALARQEDWKSAVLTFHPHPAKLVAPASAPRLLTTLEERAQIILDLLIILLRRPELRGELRRGQIPMKAGAGRIVEVVNQAG